MVNETSASLKLVISKIVNHPLTKDERLKLLVRFLKWQFISRVTKKSFTYTFVNASLLTVTRGAHELALNYYTGLAEFEEMSFSLHFLRENDFFVDIGAYMGSYTILSSAVRGARTLAIEPVFSTYMFLLKNIELNHIQDKVETLNAGVGSSNRILPFTSSLGSRNQVIGNGEKRNDAVKIQVRRLDDIIGREIPVLLKCDTEGSEIEILKGAHKSLNDRSLKAVIIELFWNEQIHRQLESAGFRAYTYDPFSREMTEYNSYKRNTGIYIRDLEFVKERLKKAPRFKVLDKYI